MDDYIKRGDAVMIAMDYDGQGNAQDASQDIAAEIASIPAENVRENVWGTWELHEDDLYGDYWECTNCHEEILLMEGDMYYNFCPRCGADMREKKESEETKK